MSDLHPKYTFDDPAPEYETMESNEIEELAHDVIPFYKVPFALLFTPSKYMLRNGVHMSDTLLVMVIWISGMSMIIDRFENSGVLSRKLPWVPTTWLELAMAAIIIGFIRGYVVYWLGGWWFRTRLGFCDVKDQDHSIAGRVYMIPGIIKHLCVVISALIGMLLFPDYAQYRASDSWFMVIAGMVTLIALFWSSFTLYFSVRAVYPAKRIWALVWFLILPILLRSVVLIGFVVAIAIQMFSPSPGLDNPEIYSGESFRFEYPSNWETTIDEVVPGPEMWIQCEPIFEDAYFEASIIYTHPETDEIDTYLTSLETEVGMELISTQSEIMKLGRYDCRGFESIMSLDGSEYVVQVMEAQIGEGIVLLARILSERTIWNTLEPGFDHILKTLRVTDLNALPPKLDSTFTVREEHVQFEIPSNWWRSIRQNDDTTSDDGSIQRGAVNIKANPPGYGQFDIFIYSSEIGLEAELTDTIAWATSGNGLENEQELSQWLGLQGSGVTGDFTYSDGAQGVLKVLISELGDGRLIEVRKLVPQSVNDLHAPGFNLIESTFKLLVEPAEVDP
tara:strand:+ start:116 stop:1801 length:1686 start_codon:yes stop_codon:yes gene_type:complete